MYQEKMSSYKPTRFGRIRIIGISLVVVVVTLCSTLPAIAASGQSIANNTPSYVATAKNLGAEDPTKIIDVSIWLNLHKRDQMDALAKDLYDPASPNYHHWLTRAQIAERFAPTAREVKTVQEFFESHNLQVVLVGGDNFFVRARGTVRDVEKAFYVELNNYQVRDKIVRANAVDPYVEGAAGLLVRSVSGLDSVEYEHPMMARLTKPSGKSDLASVTSMASADPSFYSSNCFNGVITQKFSTNADGELPIGTYTGNHLNLLSLASAGCGYTPSPIRTAYNLTGLYADGYTGTGQTIVILDWCGSSTIQNDANAFSKRFGLPLLNSLNFKIIYTPTPSLCISEDQPEINLDVEWAHAIAPGADIDLVVPPSGTLQDVDEAEFYAVNYGLGNSVSGSYGSLEYEAPFSYLDTENLISEIAALSGISTNFSSGDSGDFTTVAPQATVSAPADSPWATGVGGVTLALNSDDSIAWQSGWGNNMTMVTREGVIFDPPVSQAAGFYGGSGGGESNCFSKSLDSTGMITCSAGFPKPPFQSKLSGKFRQVPDVSWLADPFTGAVIAISIPGQSPELVWQVYGGTSLACPMFSALWAIANQEAGAPLGQAAQYLYSLPAGALTDIVPVSSAHNVKASIRESTGINNYTASEVLGGTSPATPAEFISALWDDPFGDTEASVISFGTDCSTLPSIYNDGTPCKSASALHTKVGWDNVTGVGTPNAQAFADFFKAGAVPEK